MRNKEGVVVDAGTGNPEQTKIITESDGNASFLRAARSGNLDKILEYLKGSIDINHANMNGLNALHLASKEGHVEIVVELLKRGANVNAATKKGNTPLHIASLAGQEEVAKVLIKHGATPNVQSQNGFTPLYMAAQENHDAVVKFLLANGANQSIATEDGFTPLAVALQQGHDKVVAVLLENDAKGRVRLPALHIAAKKDDCKAAALLLQNDHDPDVTSKSGFTPLHIAAHYGNENIAALLLEKNADVNFSAKHQITPLHVAAKWGKSNMVTLLVDKGAKIDASTRDGLTPLHCAARSGHDQVVDLLLEKGAPITAKTKNGLAPLHMASQGDHVDGARILLYHKAPVDDVTVDYLTALHVAAHCGHVRVAKLLLDRKADPNARALNGFTPLHIACKKNRIKVVELLLKHGASIEATTESGLTPLHVASFMGCMNIVLYLIQHGANPDVPTVRGETPLHLAARATQSDIIRILLRNGAHVDASAREQQTPLHIAARLGNVDIVGLLLQHGAAVDATTKDMYTALHIAAKEGQEEVASVLLDHGASLTATTKKGFTPLHLAAKYGNIKVAQLLLQKDAPVDAQGKNGVTPLHVAAHYNHVNVALLLLDKGAFPHATAKNGYTPLHIVAKKNQMDIATTLLEYGAKPIAESKAGFTPLHLAAQEGHTDMTTLLIEHHADGNAPARNGLTPLHLCAQEDKVNVAAVLAKNGAKMDPHTKAGYTPLHVACHFGQINMIRFLLQHGADVNATTSHGYTPLHQAAQQGHTLIINLLLEHKASPNTTTNQGQTALSIAQRLGYISVVETLKIVTETIVTMTTTTVTEEKYKVVAPETMQETFMSDSEDEGAEDTMLGDQSMHYMTTDELKALADDNTLGIDVTRDERGTDSTLIAPLTAEEDHLTPQHISHQESTFSSTMAPDNVDLSRAPVHAGFLVSFMVDARGGAMRGCRHSGVRVIIPPRRAPMPMRITCRYLRKEKLAYPPPLMEGEACASRILEVGPSGAKFLGPVVIEVPHFASLRGREREITILRSDNGETWREHTLEASDDAVHDVFNESFEGEELTAREHLSTDRITRILTTDFPQYFAIISRIRQEVHVIGPEGGMVSSTVVPQVQVIFPEGALTKKIKVGLQAQPITPELVTKLLGNRVAVSPILTVEPRRRKFHKPITLTIPVPQAATKGMINQYSGDAPTLRLLCSITGGTTKAQWEDVTGSTPLTFVNDCVSFTTTVSARFWLIDCRQVNEATKFATELYREAIHVPFMAKFVVFAKRHDPLEAQLRVFCMTDDKEDKTLESQEHFTEVAKSRDVEVLENKLQYLEFAGNLVPVTKSGEQLSLTFQAFRENRLPFTIRVKDPHQEPMGRVAFMREARVGRGDVPQSPICNLNIVLPEADLTPVSDMVTLEKRYGFVKETSLAKPELIHRADLRLSDIAKELQDDWVLLALQLDVSEADINTIRSDHPHDTTQQAHTMLRHWLHSGGHRATGNLLEKGLRKINREDIVNSCMFNVELVTDDVEKAVAKVHLDQSGFDTFKEELGPSRDASLRRDTSLNGTYDEQDIMKDAESAAESSSESSGDRHGDRKGRTVTETMIRTSAKVFEEVPETLVQGVPSDSHIINGQMSDTSIHDEDQSEPTVATLSSEATAEMEVSSLDDKSQGESHAEKKAQLKYTGSEKVCYKLAATSTFKFNPKEIPRYIKHQKQKRNVDSVKRKTISDFNTSATTSPATSKEQKLIARRSSWPPVSPLKLTRRKKYHEVVRVRNFQEPFTPYEWLTMNCAAEKFKLFPLAKFTEFEKEESLARKSNRNLREKLSTIPNKLSFYFVFNSKIKHAAEKKKYIRNSKNKCFVNKIPSLKPTTFDCLQNETPSNQNVISFNMEIVQNVPIAKKNNVSVDVTESFSPSRISYCDLNVDNIRNKIGLTSDVPRFVINQSPLRPLSYNSHGDVLICNPVPNFENRSIKQNVIAKECFEDKENIKHSIYEFPSTKYLDKRNIKNIFVQPIRRACNKPVTCNSNFIHNGYNKMVEKGIYSIPKQIPNKKQDTSPQDMMDNSNSKKNDTPANESSSSNSPASVSKSTGSAVAEQSSSNYCDNHKPSTSQFFERDVQSNFSMADEDKSHAESRDKSATSGKSKSNEDKDEDKREKEIPASVLGQAFLSTLIQENQTSSLESFIPETIIGHSFLKTFQEQSALANVQGEAIPAEVIGQSFIKNLLSNQSVSESQLDKSADAEKATSLKQSSENVLPASALGQAFLKSLISSILSKDCQTMSSTFTEENPIPANVLTQEFLKTLLQDDRKPETKLENPKAIPAPVIGKTFLKSLLEPQISEDSERKPESFMPSSIVAQSFLKSLISSDSQTVDITSDTIDQSNKVDADQTNSIPASVLAQSFLKSLISSEAQVVSTFDSKMDNNQTNPIPSSVLTQIFLKSLISVPETSSSSSAWESKLNDNQTSSIPQTFLKSLSETQATTSSSVKEKADQTSFIPSSALAQTFLKLLFETQATTSSSVKENETDQTSFIPSSVLAQTFLKSLSETQATTSSSAKEKEADQTSFIPSSVLAQTFLKSLSETQDTHEIITSDEKKSYKQTSASASDVTSVCPSFLKSFTQEETQELPYPASVLHQVFLKTLLENKPPDFNEETTVSDPAITQFSAFETPISSTVLSQIFLRSLMQAVITQTENSNEAPIPSSVVSQNFLKSLLEQAPKDSIAPSEAVSQAFLKSPLTESSLTIPETGDKKNTDSSKEKKNCKDHVKSTATIPASVVGQAFLSSLLPQEPVAAVKKDVFPASVVGLAFLKSLNDQASLISGSGASESASCKKSNVKAISAHVLGQAFLKTLSSMCDQTPSPSSMQSNENKPHATTNTELEKSDNSANGCSNGCFPSDTSNESPLISDEQIAIIPPPLEFCSVSEEINNQTASGSSSSFGGSKVNLSPNIIEELLSCTKVMQSVIENMNGTNPDRANVCDVDTKTNLL